jgi:hypothetical protein
VEDVHYGEVGLDPLLDHIMNCCHSWCPAGVVLSGLYPCEVGY